MTGSVRMRFGRALLGAAGALAVAVPLLTLPTPALAWWRGGGWHGGGGGWHGGCCWGGGWRGGVVIGVPPVYAAPPPVYYAPPSYYAPPRYWVPPHWNGPYWVPGHWA